MTVVTSGLMTLLLLMFTLTIPDPSDAEIFFDSDFELGGVDDWAANGWNDARQANPGHLEISTTKAFPGSSKSVKGTWDNIHGSSQMPSIWKSTFGGQSHIFMRVAINITPGFQLSSNGNTKLIRLTGPAYPTFLLMYRYGTWQIIMEAPYDYAGTFILDTGVAPRMGQWDQIETELLLNTPGQTNGLVRIWVNGVLKGEVLDRALRGPTPTSLCGNGANSCPSTFAITTGQIFVQSGLGTIYYDRFALGDTRIGLATSQMSSDTTPPDPPNGLQIR